MIPIAGTLAALAAALAAGGSAQAAAPHGSLETIPGPGGCIADTAGQKDCADGWSLKSVASIDISPDGRFLYVVSGNWSPFPGDSGGVAVIRRNEDGSMEQLPPPACFKRTAITNGDGMEGCQPLPVLAGARYLKLSPDGRQAYVGAARGLVVFNRDAESGELTFARCITRETQENGGLAARAAGERCERARGINAPEHIEFTRGGRVMYLATQDHAVLVFRRDPRTGALRQLPGGAGCIRQRGTEDDHLYGGPRERCAHVARGITTARAVHVSRNGRRLYVAGLYEAVGVFEIRRDHSLRELGGKAGCIIARRPRWFPGVPRPKGCAVARGLWGPHGFTESKDGRFLYMAGKRGREYNRSSVLVFRVRSDGSLSQLPGKDGCIGNVPAEGCLGPSRQVFGAHQVLLDPEERTLYTISDGFEGGIAVFRRNRSRGTLRQLPDRYGCISADALGTCTEGRLANGLHFAVPAPDWSILYTAGEDSHGVPSYRVARSG